jgi:hypothetical protein
MNRTMAKHKAALTRAKKAGPQAVLAACKAAVAEWNAIGAWPDNWHTWNIALSDARWQDASLPMSLDDL